MDTQVFQAQKSLPDEIKDWFKYIQIADFIFQKCDAPEEELSITMEGICLSRDDESIEFYTDAEESITVPKNMLQSALSLEEEIDFSTWTSKEPFKLGIRRSGSDNLTVSVL